MKYISYLTIGIFFGIIMYKSEAASWFGVIGIQIIKKYNIKAIGGSEMNLHPKKKSIARYLIGGIIFGLGWALAGACPGPMYVLAGAGYSSILVVIAAAILGTFVYGLVKDKLPH